MVDLIEQALGRKAQRELLPMQPGDVPETYADVDDLMRDVGFRPSTPIEDGIARFVAWYREYHRALAGTADRSTACRRRHTCGGHRRFSLVILVFETISGGDSQVPIFRHGPVAQPDRAAVS